MVVLCVECTTVSVRSLRSYYPPQHAQHTSHATRGRSQHAQWLGGFVGSWQRSWLVPPPVVTVGCRLAYMVYTHG